MSKTSMAQPPRIRAWFWHLVGFLWMLTARLRLNIRIEWHGMPEPGDAVLFAGKHASAFDIVLLGVLSNKRTRRKPYFQMGSFIGYRVWGRIKPALRALGGFEVMRPKEVRRLSKMPGQDRASAVETMRQVNEDAERIRREALRQGGILCFFPEGTRNDSEILPLVSVLEVASALEVAKEGTRVVVWPASVSLGPKRTFRRRCRVDFLPPFAVDPEATPQDVLAKVDAAWRSVWK